jgi:hypothetical protein
MAVLFSVQSGNWTTSTTWKVVDAISYSNTESTTTLLTTSFVSSSAFTPGAITVEGIAVKVAVRVASPTGTISVRLFTGAAAVTGTTVTLNVNDLPSTPTASGGFWVYFKFASPVVLLAATAYNVQATTSSATQVNLYVQTSAGNWNRCLVTSTNAAPAARDTLIVAGENTAAGVGVDYIVTMNNTTTTLFGSASAVFPAVEIGRRGTLTFATVSATNYQMWCLGSINIGGGGSLIIGSTTSQYPSTTTALIQFTNGAANTYQINVRPHGNILTCGMDKIGRTTLATSAGATATSLTASVSTGWYNGDNIVIGNANASISTFDQRVVAATASGTNFTITIGLTNAKTLQTNVDVEVINLTRNIRIVGNTASSAAFYSTHTYNGQVIVDLRNTEFRHGGFFNSAVDTTSTSILNFIGLSFWNLATIAIFNDSGLTNGGTLVWSDCVLFSTVTFFNTFASVAGGTAGSAIFDSIWSISTSSSAISLFANNMLTINNCRFMGSAASGIAFGNNGAMNVGPIIITNCVFKSNANGISWGSGAYTQIGSSHNISSNKFYYNTTSGINCSTSVGASNGWILSSSDVFSNQSSNILIAGVSNFTFYNLNVYGGPAQASPIGVSLASSAGLPVVFDNCTFGTPSVHTTSDIRPLNNTDHFYVNFRNCLMASTTEISNQTAMSNSSLITSARHDQSSGNHFIWELYGTLRSDPVIFRTATTSLRMTPLSAVYKLESRPVLVPVKQNQSITVGVWVRKSVAGDPSGALYNGNFPRLIIKNNSSSGIGIADLVLATASAASAGAWEYISGTSPTASDNSTFEVVVDCDGTAGWVNVDDMYFSSQNSTKGFKYWYDGAPFPSSTTQNGSAIVFV